MLNGNGILWMWLSQEKGKTFPVEMGKWISPLPWLCLRPSAPKPVLAALHSSAQNNQGKSHRQSSGTLKSMLEGSYQVRISREICDLPIHSKPHQGKGLQAGYVSSASYRFTSPKDKAATGRGCLASMPTFSLFFPYFSASHKKKKLRICVFFFIVEVSQDCWTRREETTCSPNNCCSGCDSERWVKP